MCKWHRVDEVLPPKNTWLCLAWEAADGYVYRAVGQYSQLKNDDEPWWYDASDSTLKYCTPTYWMGLPSLPGNNTKRNHT